MSRYGRFGASVPGNTGGDPELAVCVSFTSDGAGAYAFATPEEAEELAQKLVAAAAEWRARMGVATAEATP